MENKYLKKYYNKIKLKYLILSFPLIFLLIFFLTPLLIIFFYSFSTTTGLYTVEITWTLENYIKILNSIYLKIFLKSVFIASLATFICLIIGFLLALKIAFTSSTKTKNFLLFFIMLPFWINLLVRTYALIAVFRSNGFLNNTYEILWVSAKKFLEFFKIDSTNIIAEKFQPLELLYNNTAVILGLVYVHLPFMVLILYATLLKVNKSYIEASFDLGAGFFKTVKNILIPMCKFGIISGLIITFIPMLGAYITPDLLGGNDSQMIANVINRQFKSANNIPFGSALSFVLIYVLILIVMIQFFIKKRKRSHYEN